MHGSETAAIRSLTAADIEDALTLSSTAGWNQRRDDWEMLQRIAPGGSFAAISAGRIIGTAIGIDYGGFGWIAMMLVDPAYRGQGLGRRLLEAAVGAIPSDRPIRLDATPMGRPLYRSFGFEEETSLSRCVADPAARRVEPVVQSGDVHPIASTDLQLISDHDRQIFGGNRAKVLAWARDRAPQYARAAGSGGNGAQYCFGRQGRLFDQIGPVVADDDAAAQRLVASAVQGAGGRPVVVDAFDTQGAFTTWLTRCGFRVERPLFRMCRGVRGSHGGSGEFAIFGPEFG
jgi:GNAT superfamily N-acetyltransferase